MPDIETRLARAEQRIANLYAHLGLTEQPDVAVPPDIPEGDATRALIDWITTLAPGTVADFTGRAYRCDYTLALDGLQDITLRGLTLDVSADTQELDSQGRSTRRHILLTRSAGIRIESLAVTGGNVTDDAGRPIDQDGQAKYWAWREFEHGIAVQDCDDVTIDGLTVDAVRGDGVYLRRVTGGVVRNFRISRNGRQGIAIVAGRDLKILDGEIVHSRRSGIDLEPNFTAEDVDGVEIGNIKIRSRLIPVTAGGVGTVRNVHVHDINSTASSVLSLKPGAGGRRDGWTVERWTHNGGIGSPQPAGIIGGHNVTDLVFRDCVFPAQPGRNMAVFHFRNAGRVTLERVTSRNATRLIDLPEPAPDHELTVVDCVPPLKA